MWILNCYINVAFLNVRLYNRTVCAIFRACGLRSLRVSSMANQNHDHKLLVSFLCQNKNTVWKRSRFDKMTGRERKIMLILSKRKRMSHWGGLGSFCAAFVSSFRGRTGHVVSSRLLSFLSMFGEKHISYRPEQHIENVPYLLAV